MYIKFLDGLDKEGDSRCWSLIKIMNMLLNEHFPWQREGFLKFH
jgi:hypothetical protein